MDKPTGFNFDAFDEPTEQVLSPTLEPVPPPTFERPMPPPAPEPSPVVERRAERRGSMHQTALVFLEDPLARRLAVAWHACGGNEDDWDDAAGVSGTETNNARRLKKALRINGVCRDGGVTDELALKYIAVVATAPIERRIRDGKQPSK